MASSSSDEVVRIERRCVFQLWHKTPSSQRISVLNDYILKLYSVNSVNSSVRKTLTRFSKTICEQIRCRWVGKGRNMTVFLRHYDTWLDKPLCLPDDLREALQQKPGRGRPPKEFAQSCGRTRKRKIHNIVTKYSPEQLTLAAESSVRATGKRDAAKLIQEALASPKRPSKYKQALQQATAPKTTRPYTPEEALAFFMDNKLTVAQYKTMQIEAKERGYDIYPPYRNVFAAKKYCYPDVKEMTITDDSVEIRLQNLMDHTASRLCAVQEDILIESEHSHFTLFCKWGCDGSSGHSLYKQRFANSDTKTDEYLLSMALVPVRLYATENPQVIIWQNPRPSSTRFCRPIKLLYKQETTLLLQEECSKINAQIEALTDLKILLQNKEVKITYSLFMTMVDTKVCNALTETKSSQRCYICGATSKDMNKEHVIDKNINLENLNFGISSLHAYIRTMECYLHISYRLELKIWQMRGKENKEKCKIKKKQVHDLFLEKTGMHIDEPKQTAGNTNDGNAARRFFKNPNITSEITGVNEELIRKTGFLLRAISSGYKINIEKFEDLCQEIRALYIKEYSWYPMPVTLHKILYHGKAIIENCIVPIGQMSEEAQESRNKEIRKVREHHARKVSRVATNMDVMSYLFITFDPKISTIRKIPRKQKDPFPAEVLSLLCAPDI